MNAGVRRLAVSHASAIKGIRLAMPSKVFSEKILTNKELENIEYLVVKQICKGWGAELMSTGIRFRSGPPYTDSHSPSTARLRGSRTVDVCWA